MEIRNNEKILITGANSYIGTSFECYLHENYQNDYVIETLNMIDVNWKIMIFLIMIQFFMWLE